MEKAAKVILTLFTAMLSATAWGQEKIETFKELIDHIDQNTHYNFSYPKVLNDQILSIETSAGLNDPSELEALLDIPVEAYDERLTTRMAEASKRAGAEAPPDSLAAAHLLQAYLAGRAAIEPREDDE